MSESTALAILVLCLVADMLAGVALAWRIGPQRNGRNGFSTKAAHEGIASTIVQKEECGWRAAGGKMSRADRTIERGNT